MGSHRISLPQDNESKIREEKTKDYGIRVAYARSFDSLQNADPGQDFVTYAVSDGKVAFTLCDGVSQSFFGDLASKFLGEQLLDWLEMLDAASVDFKDEAAGFLDTLVEEGIRMVNEFPLPEGISPMVAHVLEQKRARGSESTFVAGLLDFSSRQASLLWAGDSRLRVWSESGEITSRLFGSDEFLTRERWSTHKGVVGQVHGKRVSFSPGWRFVAYSDGFAILDHLQERMPSDSAINNLITEAQLEPSSDDISFVEIAISGTKVSTPKAPKAPTRLAARKAKGLVKLEWNSERDTLVELELRSQTGRRHWFTNEGKLVIPHDQLTEKTYLARVRGWKDDEPGTWSKAVEVIGGQASPAGQTPSQQPDLIPPSRFSREWLNYSVRTTDKKFRSLNPRGVLLSTAAGLALAIIIEILLNKQ